MIVKRANGDLNVAYRPCRFSDVIGNRVVVNMLSNAVVQNKIPHAIMFTGNSGCGKTTMARIVALALNCFEPEGSEPCLKCDACKSILDLNSFAVIELDGARAGNVDTIRSVLDDLPSAPMGMEKNKVLIIDEAHNLTPPSKSEKALLKFLEDTPPHVYVILCTNEPQKFEDVTINRCKAIQFSRLSDSEIFTLLEEVSQFEGFPYNPEILKYIEEESNGVPRQALTYLQLISVEGSWTKEAASLLVNAGIDIDEMEIVDFCRLLVKKNPFKSLLEAYKKIKKIPPERVRINMRGFLVGCIKNAKNIEEAKRFHAATEVLRSPYFHAKPEHDLISDIFKITTILRGN